MLHTRLSCTDSLSKFLFAPAVRFPSVTQKSELFEIDRLVKFPYAPPQQCRDLSYKIALQLRAVHMCSRHDVVVRTLFGLLLNKCPGKESYHLMYPKVRGAFRKSSDRLPLQKKLGVLGRGDCGVVF